VRCDSKTVCKLGRFDLGRTATGTGCPFSSKGIPSGAILRGGLIRLQALLRVGFTERGIGLFAPGPAHHGNVCSCPVLILRRGPIL